jgi:protein O-mannosyl-transferase
MKEKDTLFRTIVLNRPGLFSALVLLILVLAIYLQSLWFGYVNYDDALILDKRWILSRKLSWDGLLQMFSLQGKGSYQPIRHLAFAVVYYFWGTAPFGYHLFNVLFYFANLWVVFLLLRKLLRYSGRFENNRKLELWAWAGTVWFAVHPIHVESVAWMVANKEMLAGFFYFSALLCYLQSWEREFSWSYYLLSWVCLSLGMLSKPSVASLPLVIIAFELVYRRRVFNLKMFALRILPFLLVVGAGAVYYIFFTAAFTDILHGSLKIHSLSFATVLAKYIKILLLPINLCASYPPPFFMGEYNYRLVIYLMLDLGIFAALAYSLIKGRKSIAFAILFFLLNLVPVSGIFPISIFMADRYLYFSSLGFVFAGLVLLSGFWDRLKDDTLARRLFAVGSGLALLFLVSLSTIRCRDWKDGLSLWYSAVSTYPTFQFNHYAFGKSLLQGGYLDEAVEAFRNVNMINEEKGRPEHVMATYYIADILDRKGDSTSAEAYYKRVIEISEKDLKEENMLASVYQRLGRMDKAAEKWSEWGKRVIRQPERVKDVTRDLLKNGYTMQAFELVTEAIQASPPSAGMSIFLAEIQIEAGEYEKAVRTIEQAMEAGEDSMAVIAVKGDLLFGLGNTVKAFQFYSSLPLERLKAVQLERLAAGYYQGGELGNSLDVFRYLRDHAGLNEATAYNNLGVILEAMDSLEAAGIEYRRALKLDPDYSDVWFNLGNLALKLDEPEQSLEFYNRTRSIEGASIGVEMARGAVLMKLERYSEALDAYRSVLAFDSRHIGAILGAADALWQLGRKADAAEYYRNFLGNTPVDSEIPDYVRSRVGAAGR